MGGSVIHSKSHLIRSSMSDQMGGDGERVGPTVGVMSCSCMRAWFAAAADTRYAGFRWTVENGRWHIKAVFGGEISSWAAWCWLDGTSHMHRKHIAPNHPDLWNLPRFMFFGWKTLTYVI
ncbi:uncharacterized protein LOC18425591 isoform X3 [Amborella trichopoda]|uniref:uncharacterized protein LOC18425591 isoform X3 n=1 Tax=Amborella trichopoda TaxID=13333 RepID=UPI0009BD304C|nr:uncharacterized protein LOC18425591 isoform X3 [Amborella trichopoda]|eukprot:XP_020517754.1 uncharacterized protein LOC18425591 isoform X3 [Amborella trichopoda]